MHEIREYAPIVIPTLNRYEHLRRCVESLAMCTHADKTELVIGLDYPPSEKYVIGWQKVKEYVYSIRGFRKITILSTDKNLGAVENVQRCKEYAFSIYNTYIATEDDNEFSPCFLDYINKALTRYWDDERITSICGYNFPVYMEEYDKSSYCHHQFSAWGYGKWKHKYLKIDEQISNHILKSPSNFLKIIRVEPKVLVSLMNMSMKKAIYGDVVNVAENIINGKFSLFPTVSLCRNHGHDGSGLHCGNNPEKYSMFINQEISTSSVFELEPICMEECTINSLNDYFKTDWRVLIKTSLRYIKYLAKK